MSHTIRFPLLTPRPNLPAEPELILTLVDNENILPIGGMADYVSLAPWKLDQRATTSPFLDIVVEFSAAQAFTVGSGTNPIGLYGAILRADGTTEDKTLLGILGINYAGTTVPQIPIVQRADGAFVGFSQVVCKVAAYDLLSVGGVLADINLGLVDDDPALVTVKVRPIFHRDWVG